MGALWSDARRVVEAVLGTSQELERRMSTSSEWSNSSSSTPRPVTSLAALSLTASSASPRCSSSSTLPSTFSTTLLRRSG